MTILVSLCAALFLVFLVVAFEPWFTKKLHPTEPGLPERVWQVRKHNGLWYVTNLATGRTYYRAPLSRWFLKRPSEDVEVNPTSGLVRRLEREVAEHESQS